MPTNMTTWKGEFTANTTTAGVQDQVRTFQLDNGDFWITWRDFDSAAPADALGSDILGQRFDPLGNSIGGPVRLNFGSASGDEQNAQFAANPNGGFVTVYETRAISNGQPFSELWLEYRTADGSFITGGGFAFGYESGLAPANPQIAIASSTSGMLVWERTNGAGDTDIMAKFINPLSHTSTQPIEVLNQADDNYDPHVVALANGNYAVVWTDEYSGSNTDLDIRGKIYSQDGTLISSVTVDASVNTEADGSIAALAGGGFVVSYTKTDGSNNGDVLFRIFDNTGTPLAVATLAASGADAQGKNSVSATADGGFVLSWSNESTGETVIQAFTGAGAAVGDPLAIVTGGTAAEAVSLTVMGDGRILVGYNVTGTDDARSVIFDPRAEENHTAAYLTGWQVGTVGDDVIVSDVLHTPGAVQIHAMAGNDLVFLADVVAGGTVTGGTGFDTLSLGLLNWATTLDMEAQSVTMNARTMTVAGFEGVEGTELSDVLAGDASANTLDGMAGDDTLQGRGGNDTLSGGIGNDILAGDAGNDILDGGLNDDAMTGGIGDDTYYVDSLGDTVNELAGEGTDTLAVGFDYVLANGSAIEWLATIDPLAINAINLTGNSGANAITGNAGANVLDGKGGGDTMIGLGGDDWYYVDNAGDLTTEAAGQGTDRVLSAVSYALVAGVSIETLSTTNPFGVAAINLTGNELANTVYGNYGNNALYGGAGNDTLGGYDGDDVLIGGAGTDALAGGLGNDSYYVDNAGDVVTEAVGQGTDRIYANVNFALAAGSSIETLSTTDSFGTTALNLTGNELANTVYGNYGNNALYGGAGNDTLAGYDGDDVLIGGAGTDAMMGGLGNDGYYVDNAGDVVTEAVGQGTDRIYTNVTFALAAGSSIETLSTTDSFGTAALNLTGNELANTVYGNYGNNALYGGAGNDTLAGYDGDDVLIGGAGADSMTGGLGNDNFYVDNAGDLTTETAGQGTDRVLSEVSYALVAGVSIETLSTTNVFGATAINLAGNELANTVYGNYGNNTLYGEAGNDTLVGYDGNDTLVGGAGTDSMAGGLGSDTFRFDSVLGAGNVDTIGDYVVADDVIHLDDAVFTGLAAGALAAGAFNTGAAATEADDRIIYNSATGALMFDADGSGAGAAIQFAMLSGGLALTASEFLVI